MADDHEQEPTAKTQLTQPRGIDPKTGKPYPPNRDSGADP
jgi:hypothetical protein